MEELIGEAEGTRAFGTAAKRGSQERLTVTFPVAAL
jgi:hypothetical protein